MIRELDRVVHDEPKIKERKEVRTVLSERRRVEAEKKDVTSLRKPSDEVPVNNMPIWQRLDTTIYNTFTFSGHLLES